MGRLLVASLILLSQVVLAQTRERYVVTDYLGSVSHVYAENGVQLERSSYKPYGGATLIKNDFSASYIGYTGGVQAAGLIDLGARHYSPELRRFISPDPVGFMTGGVNHLAQYHYANNNPLRYVDTDGRSATEAMGVFIAADAAVPEPTDVAWPKWLLYGGLIAGAGVLDWIISNNQSANGSSGEAPAAPDLPGGFVGVEDSKSGYTGKRKNSGPLDPEHGGTGNAADDFEVLTGGTRAPVPDSYPEGTVMGGNGVTLRPETDKNGPRIDIPANGDKPPEALHYPKS